MLFEPLPPPCFGCRTGNGRFGQLGLGDSSFAYYPHPRRLLGPLTRRMVLQVAVGAFHAIARTDDQEIYAWGRNDYGQLGLGLTLREQAGTICIFVATYIAHFIGFSELPALIEHRSN